jgi:hypothetical protein
MSGRSPARVAPTAEPAADRERLAAAFVAWRETLVSVKKSVDEATAAVGLLRAAVREVAPLWRSLGQFEEALAGIDWAEAMDEAAAEVEESLATSTGPQPLAPGIPEETAAPETGEPDVEVAGDAAHAFSGRAQPLASLDAATLDGGAPYSYTVTVEEVGSRVKLAPLYQSLSQVEGLRELSLKSYTNGVAVVSIESEIELEGPALREAIAAGMDKACRVVSGDGPSFLVRMGDSPASGARRKHGSAG